MLSIRRKKSHETLQEAMRHPAKRLVNILRLHPALIQAVGVSMVLLPLVSLPAHSRPQKQQQKRKNASRQGTTMINAKQAIADHEAHVEFHAGAVRFDILRIPSGDFEMGVPLHEAGNAAIGTPARRIRISQAFYLGKYEVTQAQYRAVMGQVEPSNYHGDNYPMDSVPLAHAKAFCEKLSHLTGLHVALPTEAQWEYACRAGTTTRYYTGDSVADLARAGWFRGNSAEHVHEVGQKAPNAFGLYDMLGNVGEMCQDEIYDYVTMDATDPEGNVSDGQTSLRGGAWMLPAEDCQSASRSVASLMTFQGQGLRIAVVPE